MDTTTPTLHFSIGKSFSQGWQVFKVKWTFIFLVGIVTFLAGFVPALLLGGLLEESNTVMIIIYQIANFVWNSVLTLGSLYILIRLMRNEPVELSDLMKPAKYVGRYILGEILYMALVWVGVLFLIVPGIYFALKYCYVPYLIADKGMQPGDAFSLSAKMTKGVKGSLFMFGIASFFFNLLGLLAVFVGLFITVPVTALAQTAIYNTLLAQVPNADAVEGEMVQ
jgi:uncharacterized membrane protein